MIDHTPSTRTPAKPQHGHRQVRCPVCLGLECVCRPRYFSGQLLTEADLNAEQQYVIKKNRLHNLYLHGWGVVCGLEVVCHPRCEGWVTVKQGYAIGPCGDDIVVCEDADFDVLARIEECERERRRKHDDCVRARPHSEECDADGCWYLTLRYDEQPARAMASLRADAAASVPVCTCAQNGCAGNCSGGCGCTGSRGGTAGYAGASSHAGGGHGCGCASCQASSGVANGHATTRTPLNVPCEPTRTCEVFKLDLCHAPHEPDPTCADLLEGTLLSTVYECVLGLARLVRQAPALDDDLGDDARHAACCRFLAEVRRYFDEHPTTRCAVLDRLHAISCPRPGAGVVTPPLAHVPAAAAQPSSPGYAEAVDAVITEVKRLVIKHLVDCFCLAIMPPCPADPGDDRLILACVMVRDGRIVDICNWEGRRQLVTWPVVRHWLSALPIEAVAWRLLERFCCGEFDDQLLASFAGRSALWGERAGFEQGCNERDLLRGIATLLNGVAGAAGAAPAFRASAPTGGT